MRGCTVAAFLHLLSACFADDRLAVNFCGFDPGSGKALTWDLSTLPNATFSLQGNGGAYHVAAPYLAADPLDGRCSARDSMGAAALQGCRGLGVLGVNTTILPFGHEGAGGLNLTLNGGSSNPPCDIHGPNKGNRTTIFELICDKSVPMSTGPDADKGVIEYPGCTYVITWRHPAFCKPAKSSSCGSTPTPPPPAPIPCATCQPKWAPTWNMQRSTILQTCNDTGMHSVSEAVKYGVMVYDWSNAKDIWCNAHPMSDQELLTKQVNWHTCSDCCSPVPNTISLGRGLPSLLSAPPSAPGRDGPRGIALARRGGTQGVGLPQHHQGDDPCAIACLRSLFVLYKAASLSMAPIHPSTRHKPQTGSQLVQLCERKIGRP